MAYSIVGGVVRETATRGKDKKPRPGKVIETTKQGQGAAVRIAQERGKASGTVANVATAHRVIAFDFTDTTQRFEFGVDLEAAMNADLAAAQSPAETAKLRGRSQKQLLADHPPRVARAHRVNHAFTDAGVSYPADSWVVRFDDDGEHASLTAAQFSEQTGDTSGKKE